MQSLEQKRKTVTDLLKSGGPHNRLLPLSSNQKRSWEYQKANPTSPFHNLSFQILFEGKLQVDVLEKCLNRLVTEQEALRIRIIDGDQLAMQFLTPPEDFKLKHVDLSGLAIEKMKDALAEIQYKNTNTPFDFSNEPVFAATLIRCNEYKHIVLFRSFQLVCDGVSVFFVVNDFLKHYRHITNQETTSEAVKASFLDVIEKQLSFVATTQFNEELEFWKKELKNAPPRIQFPKTKNKNSTSDIAAMDFPLEPELSARIQEACKSAGVTPFVMLLSALNLAIHRWTGMTDFLVGSVMNNRTHFGEEGWGLIGDFTNPLALRTRIARGTTLAEYLKTTKDHVMEAYSNSTVPYKSVIESAIRERDATGTSVSPADYCNIHIVMHNLNLSPMIQVNPELKCYPSFHQSGVGDGISSLDLEIQVFMINEGYVFHLECNPTTLSREESIAFVESMKRIISDLSDRSERTIDSVLEVT